MKWILPLTYFLFAFLATNAQNDSVTNDILTTRKLREGIFQKYNEFRTNSPSVEKGFTVKEDTGKYERYTLFLKKGRKIRNVYGFSDGKNVYINARIYGRPNYFVKILALGPISYFEDQRGKNIGMFTRPGMAAGLLLGGLTGGALAYAAGSGTPTNPGWVLYLPDGDGEAWALDKKTLLAIFKTENPYLYGKFKDEENKNDYKTLLRYVEEFNTQANSKGANKK